MATFPIRCFTCGKVLNHKHKEYVERINTGEEAFKILDDFRIERMCCRRMFICHATDKLEEYQLKYQSTDRIIEIGVNSSSFQESRRKVKEIEDGD